MLHFTTHQSFFLVPQQGYAEELDKIDIFLQILDESDISGIISSAYSKRSSIGRKSYNPYHLFSAILYCFAIRRDSLREIEEACRFDLRVMYLMGNESPSYKTISEFINEVIIPNHYLIFTKITSTIISHFGLNIDEQYIDGTKLEANANKYKFVWKPTHYHKELDKKIRKFLEGIDLRSDTGELIKSIEFLNKLNSYASSRNIDIAAIPRGKGKRLTPEQKTYREGYKYLVKILEYEEKEEICGDSRNSYYKTDHDATAMALKTDYYSGHGSNMHAAYNVQVSVSSGLILFYGVFQDRSDQTTLIPFLEGYKEYYHSFPKNLCADSGYGNYPNYQYLNDNHINNYVKYIFWNTEHTGKRPKMFHYDPVHNTVECLGKQKGVVTEFDQMHHQRMKDGKLYRFTGCNSCKHSKRCKEKMKVKTDDYRYKELIPEYEVYKDKARKNLQSIKGIEIRVNRSIQVEGTFGQIKQNMGYIRIRRRGIEKVTGEVMLVCLGRNIRKILSMYNKENIPSVYWEYKE